ncbi:YgaP family membrane protein [Niallia sp. 03133]|uniref:YgaP family membrane protein n=1 Tax=Niallia sp. 03133 TaxID=3458060 RepID=UPI00404423E7
MNPKPNISLINALIRITIGFTFLAWSTAKLSKKPYNQSFLVIAFLAAMKIAEGVVRFCPLVELYDNKETIYPAKQKPVHQNDSPPNKETPAANTSSSKEVSKIMEKFNPSTVFSPDDMKKH